MRKPEPLWRVFLALLAEEIATWKCRLFDHDTCAISTPHDLVEDCVCRRCGRHYVGIDL